MARASGAGIAGIFDAQSAAANDPIGNQPENSQGEGLLDDTYTVSYLRGVKEVIDDNQWNLINPASGSNFIGLVGVGTLGMVLELVPVGLYRAQNTAVDKLEQKIGEASGLERAMLQYVGQPALAYARFRSGVALVRLNSTPVSQMYGQWRAV